MATESDLETTEIPTKRAVVRTPSALAYGLAAAGTALLLPIAFSSDVFSGFFTPKYLVLLLVAALGFVPLLRLAQSSRIVWAARGAVAFLVVALVSALLSPAINLGFFGLDNWGAGWLFWLGCAGAFALGARLGRSELDWVVAGIVAAAAINSLVAIFQVVRTPTNLLALYQGSQADGLLGNPIHLEALLLGGLALIARRASLSKTRMAWWPLVLLFAVSLEFTLERVALPILLVIIVTSLCAYGIRRAAAFGGLTIAGYGIGYLAGGSGLGTRVTSGTSQTTFGTRLQIWNLALRSVVHHPFFGAGPGQVISVIAPHVSSSFALHLGAGVLPVDSHDFLVEVIATTGILGFLAFVAWIGGACLKARGPFLGCAVAMLAVELIEPLNLGITPVALLALGAATVTVAGQPTGLVPLLQWRPRAAGAGAAGVAEQAEVLIPVAEAVPMPPKPRRFRPATLLTLLLTAVALFIGITMVIGDHDLLSSYNAVPPAQKIASAVRANTLMPYWPDPATQVSEGYLQRADTTTPSAANQALVWDLVAARRDPADPALRSATGSLDLQLGNLSAARQQFLESLKLDPWTLESLEALGTIAREEHRWSESIYWYRRALILTYTPQALNGFIQSDKAHLTGT